MTVFVTDTHPLVWYLAEDFKKLPKKVKRKFDDTIEGRGLVWVPTAVILELSLLIKSNRISFSVPLHELVESRFYSQSIEVLQMELRDIFEAQQMTFSTDLFDTLIVASAKRMELPLITADSVLHKARPCEIYWD